MTERFVAADPYPWPWNGDFRRENTALMVIDMQTDFCGRGGYIDLLGYDISLTRACIEPIGKVLASMRRERFPILHTREGHRPDLADLPANKRWRSRRTSDGSGVGIGDPGPVAAYWCGASPAGTSSLSSIRRRARPSLTSRARVRLRNRPRPHSSATPHQQSHSYWDHHGRLRAHHHARGQ